MSEVNTFNITSNQRARDTTSPKAKNSYRRRTRKSHRSDISKIVGYTNLCIRQLWSTKRDFTVFDLVLLCCADDIAKSRGYFTIQMIRKSAAVSSRLAYRWQRRMLERDFLVIDNAGLRNGMKHYLSDEASNVISSFNRIMLNYLEFGVMSYNPHNFGMKRNVSRKKK